MWLKTEVKNVTLVSGWCKVGYFFPKTGNLCWHVDVGILITGSAMLPFLKVIRYDIAIIIFKFLKPLLEIDCVCIRGSQMAIMPLINRVNMNQISGGHFGYREIL